MRFWVVLSCCFLAASAWAQAPAQGQAAAPAIQLSPEAVAKATALVEEMKQAEARVVQIINQPAKQYKYDSNERVRYYGQGWFHPGATRPDFDNVDIRKTQELPYKPTSADGPAYVTSSQNAGLMFNGNELEFNAMTKFFYKDLTVPKKKLTEEEMVEVNNLYRVIGKDLKAYDEVTHPTALTQLTESVNKESSLLKGVIICLVIAFAALLLFLKMRR